MINFDNIEEMIPVENNNWCLVSYNGIVTTLKEKELKDEINKFMRRNENN